MNTREFLSLVVPENGIKVLAQWVPKAEHPRGGFFAHRTFDTTEAMASACAALDAQGRTVYHACATFEKIITTEGKNGRPKQQVRLASNALHTRALWLDLDVKPGVETAYQTQGEAVRDLGKFIRAVGFPKPLIIDSGYGVHAYWPFDGDVAAVEWKSLAALVRPALRQVGVRFDPARDQDVASVLRPVGTHNRKDPENPKPVRALTPAIPKPWTLYRDLLQAYCEQHHLEAFGPRPSFLGPDVTDELRSATEYPPSSAHTIAKHCQQVRVFRDAKGAVEYPLWRSMLGLLKHTTEGEALAHEWSSGDASYDYASTQEKLDDWAHGPATCAVLREANPSGCDGCPHKVKSPILLGYTEFVAAPEPEPVVVLEVAKPAPAPKADGLAEVRAVLGKKYSWNGTNMVAFVPNSEGVAEPVIFADSKFFPVARLRLEDGTYALRMRMLVREGQYREFDLPMRQIADKRGFAMTMQGQEVNVLNPNAAVKYVQDMVTLMKEKSDEVATHKQCGFLDDYSGFLIGDTLIGPDEDRTVLMGKSLASLDERRNGLYERQGDAQEWIDGVDKLYNCPEGLPYQFAICTAFGGILAPMLEDDEWRGIPLALTTDKSGRGKSTVAKIAIGIYTKPSKLTVGQTTANAISGNASMMNHLPCLFDEVTGMEPKALGEVLYALSNGRTKERLTSGGQLVDGMPEWTHVSFITGNNNILHRVTETKQNPEALQMRCFEVDLSAYPALPSLEHGHPDQEANTALARRLVNNCYGEIGQAYLRWVLKNRGAVVTLLRQVHAKMESYKAAHGSVKERYYFNLLACSLTGGLIAQKLGFVKFDMKALRKWAVDHVANMREQVVATFNGSDDLFSRMLTDLRPQTLYTKHYDKLDGRRGTWELLAPNEIPATIVARVATEDKRIYISAHAIDAWCKKNGVNAVEMKRGLHADGFVRHLGKADAKRGPSPGATVPIYLGKGVKNVAIGLTRCLEFNFDRAVCNTDLPEPATVIHMEPKKGKAA